ENHPFLALPGAGRALSREPPRRYARRIGPGRAPSPSRLPQGDEPCSKGRIANLIDILKTEF
ncbi:MAG: hypothetical protein ACO1SV_16690, partial [Fimbriimonas sp.]